MSEPMSVKERVELSRGVIDDLIQYIDIASRNFNFYPSILKHPIKTIGMGLSLLKAQKIRHSLTQYKLWLQDADHHADWHDAHELVCEFNDLLPEIKKTLIQVFSLSIEEMEVNAEELFNVLTYGGRV